MFAIEGVYKIVEDSFKDLNIEEKMPKLLKGFPNAKKLEDFSYELILDSNKFKEYRFKDLVKEIYVNDKKFYFVYIANSSNDDFLKDPISFLVVGEEALGHIVAFQKEISKEFSFYSPVKAYEILLYHILSEFYGFLGSIYVDEKFGNNIHEKNYIDILSRLQKDYDKLNLSQLLFAIYHSIGYYLALINKDKTREYLSFKEFYGYKNLIEDLKKNESEILYKIQKYFLIDKFKNEEDKIEKLKDLAYHCFYGLYRI